MLLVHDLVFAKPTQLDKVLNSANHASKYQSVSNVGLSIDDVVTLLSIHRQVQDKKKEWSALRRKVYDSFKESDSDVNRTVALLTTDIQREVSEVVDSTVPSIVSQWPDGSIDLASKLLELISACREAERNSVSIIIKSYPGVNAFELAIEKLTNEDQEKVKAKYQAWDASRKESAHEKIKYLQLIGRQDCVAIVIDEIENGNSHCATFAFLTAIQKTVESTIMAGINAVDYLDQFDPATISSISKFKLSLDASERKQILRAFSITLMSDILSVVENGDCSGVPSCPTGWALIDSSTAGPTDTLSPLGELHAYLDGSSEFWPREVS